METHIPEIRHLDIPQRCLPQRIQNEIILFQSGIHLLPEMAAVPGLPVMELVLTGITAEFSVGTSVYDPVPTFQADRIMRFIFF